MQHRIINKTLLNTQLQTSSRPHVRVYALVSSSGSLGGSRGSPGLNLSLLNGDASTVTHSSSATARRSNTPLGRRGRLASCAWRIRRSAYRATSSASHPLHSV